MLAWEPSWPIVALSSASHALLFSAMAASRPLSETTFQAGIPYQYVFTAVAVPGGLATASALVWGAFSGSAAVVASWTLGLGLTGTCVVCWLTLADVGVTKRALRGALAWATLAFFPRVASVAAAVATIGIAVSIPAFLFQRKSRTHGFRDLVLNALWPPRRAAWRRFVQHFPVCQNDRKRWLLAARSDVIRALPRDLCRLLYTRYVVPVPPLRMRDCFARIEFAGSDRRGWSDVPRIVEVLCDVEVQGLAVVVTIGERVIYQCSELDTLLRKAQRFLVVQGADHLTVSLSPPKDVSYNTWSKWWKDI